MLVPYKEYVCALCYSNQSINQWRIWDNAKKRKSKKRQLGLGFSLISP